MSVAADVAAPDVVLRFDLNLGVRGIARERLVLPGALSEEYFAVYLTTRCEADLAGAKHLPDGLARVNLFVNARLLLSTMLQQWRRGIGIEIPLASDDDIIVEVTPFEQGELGAVMRGYIALQKVGERARPPRNGPLQSLGA